MCGNKKSKFIKEQETSGLLSQLGNGTPLSKIPLLGGILGPFTKSKTRIQKLEETGTLGISIGMKYTRLVFNIYGIQRFQIFTKKNSVCTIVNRSMTDITVDLYKWSANLLIRRLDILVLIQAPQLVFLRINNWPINYTSPSLESLKSARYTHLIKITFKVLILQTCS